MSFPVTIAPTPQGYDFGNSARGNQFAFQYLGNDYAFVMQGGGNSPTGDYKVHAMKSTDGGNTWVEQDSAHAPHPTLLSSFQGNFTIVVDGAKVILMTATATAGNPPVLTGLQWWTYSLTTDLWGSSTTSSAVTLDYMGRGISQSTQLFLEIAVRGANDYVMLYSGPQSGSGGTALARVYVVTFNGTTFGTPTIVPGQSSSWYFPQEISYAPVAAKFYIAYLGNTANSLNVISWDGTTFGTNSVVTTNVNLTNEIGSFSELLVYTNSGQETLGSAGSAVIGPTVTEQFYSAPTNTNPLVWTTNSISTASQPVDQGYFLVGRDVSLVLSGTQLTVFWVRSDNNIPLAEYFTTSAPLPGTTWTTPTVLFHSSQESNFFQTYQVLAYTRASGSIGILGMSSSLFNPNIDSEILEFFATAASVSPPTCSLSAVPTSGSPGTTITLTWTTTNTPTSASINNGVGAVNPNGGSTTVSLPSGSTTYVLTVMNSAGTSTCQVTVIGAVISAGCGFVIAARVGVPFTKAFTATGGTPPYTFAITGGNLPFGITLAPSTGAVSGTPTQSGLFFFTISATDSNGLVATVNCSIPVACP